MLGGGRGEKKKGKKCLITNSLRSPIVLSNDSIQRHSLSVKRLLSVMKLADCTIFLLGAGVKASLFFFFFFLRTGSRRLSYPR